jgi:DNA-binding CsgD family transcriptional regulator
MPGPKEFSRSPLLPSDAWAQLSQGLRLSPREVQIVQLVFEDMRDGSIAFELALSPHTVSTYLRRLYTKLQVSSRPQLILRVMAEYLTFLAANRTLDTLPCDSKEKKHVA